MITAGQGVSSSGSLVRAVSISRSASSPALFLAFLVAVIAHAVGRRHHGGVLVNGRIAEGLQHATIMLAVGWLIMRFVVPPLNVG